MNILIPHKWLQEHLDTQADPQTIQTQLSLCGPAVEHIYDRDGDSVYDIEVTTNRVDSMSVRGIAREAAVILDNAGIPSQLRTLELTDSAQNSESPLPLPTIDNSSQLCQRITAVVLQDVEHQPTPEWMAERLTQVDLNVKDILIDITNYLSHDLGHPCHAFDYDKIMQLGGEIHVREAQAGQPFTTLDGETHQTVGGEVVFTNSDGTIIDIPGIMGTLNTAVDEHTKNILFWIESIAPEKIRFTSMTHALRTPAAQLNERALDHNLAPTVLRAGIQMYTELTHATQASPIYDEVTTPSTEKILDFQLTEVQRYLGIELGREEVQRILQQLGCQVETLAENSLRITLPSFRTDLSMAADIVEEIARIYGYHNLPSVLMDTAIPTKKPDHTNFDLEQKMQTILATLGYQELITYSLVGTEHLAKWNRTPENYLTLKNPLTNDMEYLRQHILPSHVELTQNSLATSTARGTFELAHIYLPQEGQLPQEKLILAVMDTDFRQLRTTLDFLTHQLFLRNIVVKKHEDNTKKDGEIGKIFTSEAIITHHDRVLGSIGYLPNGRVGMELSWSNLLEEMNRWPEYRPIPKTAAYYEDWTVEIPKGHPVGEILNQIKDLSPHIQTVQLLDTFENRWTFRLSFLDENEQFSRERVQPIREKALTILSSLGANLQQ